VYEDRPPTPDRAGRHLFTMACQTVWSCQPSELSFLRALFHARSASSTAPPFGRAGHPARLHRGRHQIRRHGGVRRHRLLITAINPYRRLPLEETTSIRHNHEVSKIPALYKVAIGLFVLSLVIRGLKWISGAENYVYGPFDTAILISMSLGVLVALTAAVRGFLQARRHEYEDLGPEKVFDNPRDRLRLTSAGMLVAALAGLGSILSNLASTDGNDRYTTSPLEYASYINMGLTFVLAVGLIAWGHRRGL
jgi:hypothetical protein